MTRGSHRLAATCAAWLIGTSAWQVAMPPPRAPRIEISATSASADLWRSGASDRARAYPRSYVAGAMPYVRHQQRTQFLIDWSHALRALGGPRELLAAALDDCADYPSRPPPSPFARTLVDRAFVARTTDAREFAALREYTLTLYASERLPELLALIDATRASRALDAWLRSGAVAEDFGERSAILSAAAAATAPSAVDMTGIYSSDTPMVLCHNLEVTLKYADWRQREWNFHLPCD